MAGVGHGMAGTAVKCILGHIDQRHWATVSAEKLFHPTKALAELVDMDTSLSVCVTACPPLTANISQVSETILSLPIDGNNLLSKTQEKKGVMLQAGEPAQERSSVLPHPWETLVWSSVKGEKHAHRKLAFTISRAQGATYFLFNSNSCADSETNVATTKVSVVVPIILCTCFLYLFQI